MFNMQRASCNPVLQYAENRDLRRQVYLAYVNRGNQGNAYDSKEISRRIIELRIAKAKLLGQKDFASVQLETRMAKTSDADIRAEIQR